MEINKSKKFYIVFIGFILLGILLIYNSFLDITHPVQCVSSSKVVDILSLEGRNATIKLENGQKIQLNQAYLNKGDSYCLAFERKK
jgi:hypothetical protein